MFDLLLDILFGTAILKAEIKDDEDTPEPLDMDIKTDVNLDAELRDQYDND